MGSSGEKDIIAMDAVVYKDITKADFVAMIFEKHGDFIRSVINFHIHNPALADDIFQDIFLTFLVRPVPEKIGDVRSFLYRVVVNDVIDAQRHLRRHGNNMHRYAQNSASCPPAQGSTAVACEGEEMDKMFQAAERLLAPREAQAVILRYRHQCEVNEAAVIMKVDSKSISHYLSTGLRKLRRTLTS